MKNWKIRSPPRGFSKVMVHLCESHSISHSLTNFHMETVKRVTILQSFTFSIHYCAREVFIRRKWTFVFLVEF